MKDELLSGLDTLLTSDTPIKFHVEDIYALRTKLENLITDEEKADITNRIRNKMQDEALDYWENNGSKWSAVLIATGGGKSKLGVKAISKAFLEGLPSSLVVVPTEKLRDDNWKDEFYKWYCGGIWDNNHVERACYASLSKFENREFGVVVLDEGHNITELNSTFFQKNKVHRVLWLSATKPRDKIKVNILKNLNINPVYEITLDEAVKLGLVAPFDITVVTLNLCKEKNIAKKKRDGNFFYVSEEGDYNYLTTQVFTDPSKRTRLNRMRFIYDLKSKTEAAKYILDNHISKELRTIIFCGSKNQANQLCEHHYYSRPSKPSIPKKLKGTLGTKTDDFEVTTTVENSKEYKKYVEDMAKYNDQMAHYHGDTDYNLFKSEQINQLACVEALNEGENIPNLDIGIGVQINSNELDLWQRLGRTIRFRIGHRATFIILAVENTEDMTWVRQSVRNLDTANVRWISLDDLKSGKETIKFN